MALANHLGGGYLVADRAARAFLADPRDRSDPLDWNGKHISDAALGLDDSRRVMVALELASEAKNLHVDAAIEDVVMRARGLQKVLTAKWAPRRIEKGKQQCILAPGQGYGSAVWVSELPGLSVELPAGKLKAATLGVARRSGASLFEPSQHRAHAREQFTQIERFGQIIVGAELKPDDPIDVIAAMTGHDENRYVRTGPDLPQQIQTVFLTEAKIEDHKIHLAATKLTAHFPPARRYQGADVVPREIV